MSGLGLQFRNKNGTSLNSKYPLENDYSRLVVSSHHKYPTVMSADFLIALFGSFYAYRIALQHLSAASVSSMDLHRYRERRSKVYFSLSHLDTFDAHYVVSHWRIQDLR